jgi:hypothetical protein
MNKHLTYLLAVALLFTCTMDAQFGRKNEVVATITATATIVGNVNMIIVKDLEFEVDSLSSTALIVNPQSDPRSGEIKIIGNPNSLIRVTNEKMSVLQHENGQSQLYFTYNLSGSTTEIQRKSALLTQNNVVRLSDRGVFFLWVGGQLSGLENISPGNYTMDLTIEVEYIL